MIRVSRQSVIDACEVALEQSGAITISREATMQKLYMLAYLGGVAWLLGWELSAFAIGRTDLTISDFTWQLEGIGWTAARYLIFAGLLWLTFHLSFRWFR